MSVASAELRAARRARGDALTGLASGVLSPADLLELASAESGRPLRHIPVRSLLRELGSSEKQSRELIRLLLRIVQAGDANDKPLTVAWVIDRRTNGRRVTALADVLVSSRLVLSNQDDALRPIPSEGWPYALPGRQ